MLPVRVACQQFRRVFRRKDQTESILYLNLVAEGIKYTVFVLQFFSMAISETIRNFFSDYTSPSLKSNQTVLRLSVYFVPTNTLC